MWVYGSEAVCSRSWGLGGVGVGGFRELGSEVCSLPFDPGPEPTTLSSGPCQP